MARDEADREDLLAEATALVERIELDVPGEAEAVVVGFRRDGAASFFFGADPVYQFNAARELRRAFVDGLLYKAVSGHLAELRRERSAGATVLWRRDLDGAEQGEFLARAAARLDGLRAALEIGGEKWWAGPALAPPYKRRPAVLRQVPAQGDVLMRVRHWLDKAPTPLVAAQSARV